VETISEKMNEFPESAMILTRSGTLFILNMIPFSLTE
jgi:hypothetical protein